MPVTAKGLEGIIANSTALSDVRGAEGVLIYAGYDINELAGKVSYEEIVHLLWHGHLPNRAELDDLTKNLRSQRELPQGVIDFIKAAPKTANPMDVIRTGVSMLGLYDSSLGEDIKLDENRQRAVSITAKIGVIAAYFHRSRQGLDLPPVRTDLSEAGHFLYLLNGETPSQDATDTLDIAYVLHADHGMNASTFSARVTVATLSDIYSAITSAIGTLKGPLHGGANEQAMTMLRQIKDPDAGEAWIMERLARKEKVMGFGHRIYRSGDSRVPVMRQLARDLGRRTGRETWAAVCERLEAVMQREKGLYANVDLYAAPVLQMLGIPWQLNTPVFACSRVAGWCAHVIEQHDHNRLIRPRSLYTGPARRPAPKSAHA